MDKKPNDTNGFQTGIHPHVAEAATELLNESKKAVNQLYNEGKHKVSEAKDNFKEYSSEVASKVQENPVRSLLIAGGIGFLLAAILRR